MCPAFPRVTGGAHGSRSRGTVCASRSAWWALDSQRRHRWAGQTCRYVPHGLLVLCRKKSPASSLVSRGCVHHSAVALLILTDAFSLASVLCDIHEALQMLKKKNQVAFAKFTFSSFSKRTLSLPLASRGRPAGCDRQVSLSVHSYVVTYSDLSLQFCLAISFPEIFSLSFSLPPFLLPIGLMAGSFLLFPGCGCLRVPREPLSVLS